MSSLDDYEPLEYYTSVLRDSFRKNCEDYFDALVKRSGVSPEENARTVQKYNAAANKADHALKKLNSGKVLRGFIIFFMVAALIAGAVLLYLGFSSDANSLPYILSGALCAALGIALLVLMLTKIKSMLKSRRAKYEKNLAAANAIREEAFAGLAPLNALYHWGMTRELIEKTAPFIKLDDCFDVKKLDLLCRKYGYLEDRDPNSSTVFVLSGSVDENPFLFRKVFRCTMGEQTYTGSIVIHWTTYSRDSKGNMRSVNHTQTLTASVTKPAPFYGYETRMYYGNEAAPDLHFSRQPTHANRLDEKELERKIKRGGKKLAKKTRQAVSSGTRQFTEMASTDFEVLFGALDRDNEVQFRLMFTPLAQQNMLSLITSDEGYGDDFAFYKNGCVNCIRSDHAQGWQTETDPSRYISYDLAASRAAFVSFNTEYFRSLYFDLAPVLSVPLYRMQKPREFIYRDVYSSNYTAYEAEVLANRFDPAMFAHKNAKTRTILKADFVKKDGLSDRMCISASSYDTVEHVEYVSVLGGDGRVHAVPVPWTEYIPVSRTSDMAVKSVGGTREAYEGRRAEASLAGFMRRFSDDGASAFCNGLIAVPVMRGLYDEACDMELNTMFGINAGGAKPPEAEAVNRGIAAAERAERALDGHSAEDGGNEPPDVNPPDSEAAQTADEADADSAGEVSALSEENKQTNKEDE